MITTNWLLSRKDYNDWLLSGKITTIWLLSRKDNNELVAIWQDNNELVAIWQDNNQDNNENGRYRALWLLNKITTNAQDNNQCTR